MGFLKEQIEFPNKHFFSEEMFSEAIEKNEFKNMKARVVGSKIWIEELKDLGHDWVITGTTVQMERDVLGALAGELASDF